MALHPLLKLVNACLAEMNKERDHSERESIKDDFYIMRTDFIRAFTASTGDASTPPPPASRKTAKNFRKVGGALTKGIVFGIDDCSYCQRCKQLTAWDQFQRWKNVKTYYRLTMEDDKTKIKVSPVKKEKRYATCKTCT